MSRQDGAAAPDDEYEPDAADVFCIAFESHLKFGAHAEPAMAKVLSKYNLVKSQRGRPRAGPDDLDRVILGQLAFSRMRDFGELPPPAAWLLSALAAAEWAEGITRTIFGGLGRKIVINRHGDRQAFVEAALRHGRTVEEAFAIAGVSRATGYRMLKRRAKPPKSHLPP